MIFAEGMDRKQTRVPLSGVDAIREIALSASIEDLSDRCGVSVDAIRDVARRFGRARSGMCITRTGAAHAPTGTIAEWLSGVINAVTDRLEQPGGRRMEPGYVDIAKIWEQFAPASKHRSRLRDLPTVAGFHSLAELPDEITTPGDGQIRGLLMTFGNPVVSGPDGAALDAALSQLELLVSIDFVQRESHRHAHWLIPGTHFLEREGLHPLFSGLMERPFAQYSRQAVKPPEGILEEWEFFTELALAMNRNLFGKPGVNKIIRASRALSKATNKPGLALNPRWMERLMVRIGKRLRYEDIRDAEHGLEWGKKEYGHLAKALRTPDKTVHCAPPRFLLALKQALKQRQTSTSHSYPMLMINRRSRESMNSWLNETPGMFTLERGNSAEMHPEDAAGLGLVDGQRVRISSEVGSIELPIKLIDGGRPGVVTVAHGWGSRIFNPTSGEGPVTWGANRNLLVDRHQIDPIAQTPPFNATPVRVEALAPSPTPEKTASSSVKESA